MARAQGPDTRLEDLRLVAVVEIDEEATLVEAAREMIRAGVSAVVVGVDAIVTERDLVHAVARGLPQSARASEVASTHPWCIRSADTVMDALAAMVRHGVRHLVVVADGSGGPVGFVTLQELVEVVLGESQVPQWLTAFRLALRAEPGPRGSEVG